VIAPCSDRLVRLSCSRNYPQIGRVRHMAMPTPHVGRSVMVPLNPSTFLTTCNAPSMLPYLEKGNERSEQTSSSQLRSSTIDALLAALGSSNVSDHIRQRYQIRCMTCSSSLENASSHVSAHVRRLARLVLWPSHRGTRMFVLDCAQVSRRLIRSDDNVGRLRW
jgi:hypothetical protein